MRLPFFSTPSQHCCSPLKYKYASLGSFPPTPATSRKPRWLRMDGTTVACHRLCRKQNKVIVIMGATGSGKSRLSIDLATRFPFSEIINSDKIQVYRGLEITTNKIPVEERNGIVHHLLGEVDTAYGEFTPSDFRLRAGSVISDINSRGKLPIIVGGSNSFIHALLAERFDPESNVFNEPSSSSTISSELRYKCCFLWVDVSFPVLSDYLLKRVDEMLDSRMVDELAEFFTLEADDLKDDSAQEYTGLRKAIGVPEFNRYFKKYPPSRGSRGGWDDDVSDRGRKAAYEEAVRAIKDNTCQLAKRQIGKILRLEGAGWDLRRLVATEAFQVALMSGCSGGDDKERWSDIWERRVLEPSVKIVNRFLKE